MVSPVGQQPKAAFSLQSVFLHACHLAHHGSGISNILVSLLQFRFHRNRFIQLPFSFSFGESSPVTQMAFWNSDKPLWPNFSSAYAFKNSTIHVYTEDIARFCYKLTCSLTASFHSCSCNVFFDGFSMWGKMSPDNFFPLEDPFCIMFHEVCIISNGIDLHSGTLHW